MWGGWPRRADGSPTSWCRLQCWLVSLFSDGWGTWAGSILVGHPSTHTTVTNDIPMEHHPTGCIPLLRAALIGYHTPGDRGQWKWISSQLSGQSPKPECGQVWALSGNPEENFIPCLSPGFCCLLAILGILWLVPVPLQSLPPSLHGSFACSPFCLIRTMVIGFRAHLINLG